MERVAAVLDDLHRLSMRQRRCFRVCDGHDDVTGLELRRRHAPASYLKHFKS